MALRCKHRLLLLVLMLIAATFLGGCGQSALIQRRESDLRDLKEMADGNTSEVAARKAEELKTVYDSRSGVMITKTQADVYAFIGTAKYYAIVGAVVCFVIGLLISKLLGSSSMTMKRMGSFLMVMMPILCIAFVVVSTFVVDVLY